MNAYDYAITGYLWIAQIIAGVVLLGIIVRRNSWRDVPVFTLYSALVTITQLLNFYVASHYYGPLYYRTYWYGQLAITIVLFGVIAEVLKSAFKTACSVFGTQIKLLRRLSTLVVCVIAVFSFQIPASPSLDEFVRRLDRASSLLLLASFGITALISNYFGLVWKPKVYGVALGFLFYYGVSAFVTVLMAGFHFAVPALNAVNVLTFLITELIWVGYFAHDNRRQTISLADIERLREALTA